MEESGVLTYANRGLVNVDSCIEVQDETSLPVEHTVKPGETLRSIAAFYDTTPSHLARANKRTSSSLIFPGEKIIIPPPDNNQGKEPSAPSTPSHAGGGGGIQSQCSRHSVVEEVEIYEKQFIKINVKHVTDGAGVVLGSLLVTPKTVMFNPNPTDLLVMESAEGADEFEIIAPPELVVNWAIFRDFGKFNSSFGIGDKESEHKKHLFVPVQTAEEEGQDHKDTQKDKDTEDQKVSEGAEGQKNKGAEDQKGEDAEDQKAKHREGQKNNDDEDQKVNNNGEGQKNKDRNEEKKENNVAKDEATKKDCTHGDDDDDVGLTLKEGQCSGCLTSQVSDEPLYMRLVMGKPLGKKLPRTAPIMSYGQQTLEPEYWFIIQSTKAVKLYQFIQSNYPEKYGLLDHRTIERSGYEVIRPGMKLMEEDNSCNRDSVSKLMRKSLTMASVDIDLISEMIGGESELINSDDRLLICRELPPRADGHNWLLSFSTSRDGFNLHSLYRKLAAYRDTPVLLAAQDLKGHIFGAYLTSAPRLYDHFLGTGETFVFTLKPEFKAFHWTGENEYFLKGGVDSLIVGSANGKFALWIDADLNQGRSEKCSTFDNETLAASEDFTIKTLEIWAFVL